MVRCRKVLLREIDDWRRKQDDLPTRPEAIRRLVQQALKAKGEPVTNALPLNRK